MDIVTWAPVLGAAAGSLIGGCTSVAASWLVVSNERRTRYDAARTGAYSRLLARSHEVLAAGPGEAEGAVGEYLEAHYGACVLASGPVADAAALLHEAVRARALGEGVGREAEDLLMERFVAAAKGELGVAGRGPGVRRAPWPSAYRVLRLPRGGAGRRRRMRSARRRMMGRDS